MPHLKCVGPTLKTHRDPIHSEKPNPGPQLWSRAGRSNGTTTLPFALSATTAAAPRYSQQQELGLLHHHYGSSESIRPRTSSLGPATTSGSIFALRESSKPCTQDAEQLMGVQGKLFQVQRGFSHRSESMNCSSPSRHLLGAYNRLYAI